jgi:hypothetical protein
MVPAKVVVIFVAVLAKSKRSSRDVQKITPASHDRRSLSDSELYFVMSSGASCRKRIEHLQDLGYVEGKNSSGPSLSCRKTRIGSGHVV